MKAELVFPEFWLLQDVSSGAMYFGETLDDSSDSGGELHNMRR